MKKYEIIVSSLGSETVIEMRLSAANAFLLKIICSKLEHKAKWNDPVLFIEEIERRK